MTNQTIILVNCRSLALAILLSIFGCATSTIAMVSPDELTRLVDATEKLQMPDRKKYATILAWYTGSRKLLSEPRHLTAVLDVDLEKWFRAIARASYVTSAEIFLDDLRGVAQEMERRQLLQPYHSSRLFSAAIQTRNFAFASEILRGQKSIVLESLPEVQMVDSTSPFGPREWRIESNANRIVRTRVEFPDSWYLLVVSHPHCSFSRKAVQEISADAVLTSRLGGRSKWVAPQDGSINFASLQAWNRLNPNFVHSLVHHSVEWPVPTFSQTPIFYFLRNGALVETVTGWPADTGKKDFLDALDRVAAFAEASASAAVK